MDINLNNVHILTFITVSDSEEIDIVTLTVEEQEAHP